ncbi:hypothetical protein H1R20_g7649, partial [Candolleomyces eurysporus]
MITLYDFPTSLPGKSISPHTWRVRLALNLKGIEHQTEWILSCDLEKRLRELDIPPSEIEPDGTPAYTVPAIYDSSTNARISDSLKIIKYLDETYPDTPKLLSPGTEVLTEAFTWAVGQNMRFIWPFTVVKIIASIDEKSSLKFQGVFESKAKMNIEEFKQNTVMMDKLWKDMEEGYSTINDWRKAASKSPENQPVGPWITGKDIKLPDIVLAANLAWPVAVFGEDSEEWKKIGGWNDGRWKEYWGLIKQYATVH